MADNVPKIRFPGFTEPWEQRKLGEIAPITMGQSPDGATYSDTPSDHILIQGNADLVDGWVKPRIWTTKVTKTADAGDLIMSVRAPAGVVGKTSFDAVIGRGVAAIKGNEFIFQTLKRMEKNGYWKPLSSGSTFESLNADDICNAVVATTEHDEQKAIGAFLQQFDNLITLHQRKLDDLKKLKSGLLQKMFPKAGETVPEVRFPEFTGDWEQRKLGEMASFAKGNGYTKADLSTEGKPIILYGRLYTDYETVFSSIDTRSGQKPGSLLSKGGEVVVPASGETADEIARASVVMPDGIILGGDLNVITPNQAINPVFLAIELSSGNLHKVLASKAQGKSVVHLHNSDLQTLDVVFPSLDEQSQIGLCFEEFDALITLHQRKLFIIAYIK